MSHGGQSRAAFLVGLGARSVFQSLTANVTGQGCKELYVTAP